MKKRKEIKFRRSRYGNTLEGRQSNVIYRIHEDGQRIQTCAPAYSVNAYDMSKQATVISTSGHQYFHLDAAKRFCQEIAAGGVDLENLQAQFDAEDCQKEQDAVKAATERAKVFRDKLDAAGISYSTLLNLEKEREALDGMTHNILMGLERGEV
jgi:hypothetical protein